MVSERAESRRFHAARQKSKTSPSPTRTATHHPQQLQGSPVVLFFYPKADTPGCTIEACGFRDHFAKLKKAGVVVLGISRDTVKAQKKFAEKYDLQYPLLADADQTICNRFGVIKRKEHVRQEGHRHRAHHLRHRPRPEAASTTSTRSSPKATPKKCSRC